MHVRDTVVVLFGKYNLVLYCILSYHSLLYYNGLCYIILVFTVEYLYMQACCKFCNSLRVHLSHVTTLWSNHYSHFHRWENWGTKILSKFPKVKPAHKWQNSGDQVLEPILLTPLSDCFCVFICISNHVRIFSLTHYFSLPHLHLFILETVNTWRSRLKREELCAGAVLPLKVVGLSLSLSAPGQSLQRA